MKHKTCWNVIAVIVWLYMGRIIPCVAEPLTAANLCVTGIIYDDRGSVAIINDKTYARGDKVGNVEILEIRKDKVVFQYKDNQFSHTVGEGCTGISQILSQKRSVQKKSENSFPFPVLPPQVLGLLIPFFVVTIGLYIYTALALQTIAHKTGTENCWLAWVPVANLFLMLLIAKKPLWWAILLFLPIVNIVIMVIVWVAIAEARGKPGWVAALLFLPVVNLVALGYLAFSE